ncbi:MAG TPA: trigger factor [Tepidisphaeraceae bacterium]|nr:trigger factor [Tepidisphaeraceae bacterium]
MAENQAAVEEQQEEKAFDYPIKIEDAGPATKKVTVEIPRDRIEQKIQEQFKELRQQAAIPGFRVGHAPQKLIEKRFSNDIKEQVKRTLVSESYEQAIEKNKLQVIGEPQFDNPDAIKLPDEGPLSYSFQVEVQPDFKLPDMSGLKVKKPKIQVNDENVDQAMQNLREQQGTLLPVEDRGITARDRVIADVHIKLDGQVIGHQHDAEFVAKPGRISGIDVADLDKQLDGARSGETKTIKVHVPDTHTSEQIRGKDVEIEFAIKDIKRLELVDITPEFLADLGFQNEKELREALREQMVERITFDVQSAMRDQVHNFLIENTPIDLPSKLSERQEQRIVSRRAMDLMVRGMAKEQIESNIERLRQGARDEGSRELKLFFILEKIAADQGVEVSESELNSRVAMLAIQRGARPEKLKQQMAKDGSLANMYVQMREQKAVDKLIESAQIEEVDVQS